MSSQIQITGETKVKSLTGVLVGTSGVVSSLNIDGSLGIPQLDVNGKIIVSQLPNYGTVTSVAVTETGDSLNITGSPITTSGTINIGFNGTNLQYINGAGDLTTFPTLSGYVTSVTGTAPVVSSGGTTPAISMAAATTSVNGYLTSTDWTTFNSKEPAITSGTTLQYYRGDKTFQTLNTSVVPELTNLYYTDVRARAALSFVAGSGAYNSTTGVITIPTNNNQITNGSNYITLTSLSSSATGLTYTNTTGVFSLTAGYVIPTTSSATTWDTAYTNRITSATAPLGIASNVISITQSGAASNGYLSSTDWNTFNNKQATITTGNLIEATSSVLTITGGTGSVLGSGTTIQVTQATGSVDGFLDSADWTTFNGKQNALGGTGIVKSTGGTISYLTDNTSNWDAAYNDKINSAAVTGTTTKTLTLTQQDGGTIIATWTDDNTDAVTSVFGRTGAVVATSGDYTTAQVTESGSLYFTDSRARLALSFVAGSGAYNSTTGVITIPTNNNQITNGAGYTTNVGTVTSVAASSGTGISISGSPITTSGTITITNTAPDQTVALTASTGISVTGTYPNFTITNTSPSSGGTVTSVAALTLGTTGTDLSSSVATSTTTPVITLNVPTASASNRGALSSADWSTFNGKESVLTFSSPLVRTTNTISIPAATTSVSGYLSSTDFSTFNSKQGTITLTTTGTSGVATFSANTLNIPNYGSALSGYLPLSGGTLTGSVIVTSASTSGFVVNSTNNASYRGFTIQVNGTTQGGMEIFPNTGEIRIGGYSTTNDYFPVIYSDGVAALSFGLGATPSATFTGALSGTSATFSGALTFANGGANYLYGGALRFLYSNGTNTNNIYSGGANGLRVINQADTTALLTIADTGAATFSGTITTNTSAAADNNFKVQNSTNAYASAINLVANNDDGARYNYINSSTNGGATHWQIGGGSIANTMVLYTGGVARLTIASTGAATFSSSVTAVNGIFTGNSSVYATSVNGASTTGSSYGLLINAGTNSIDYIIRARNYATTDIFTILGNGAAKFSGALSGTSAVLSGFLGVNGSTGTSFPFEAYINSSTAYSSTSRGNVMRVYNSNTGANIFAGIELGGAGTANDGLAGLNATVTGSGSAALTFYTRDGGTFAEKARITSAGNVGIGTTTIGSKLQVNGNAAIGYSASTAAPTNGLVVAGNILVGTTSENSYGSATSIQINGSAGSLLETRYNGTTALRLGSSSDHSYFFEARNVEQRFSTNSILRIVIGNGGVITIANLAGTGSRAVLADASGNLSAPVSDISVKQNITSIGYGLKEISKMNPVWFDFIDEYKNYGEGRQNGNIAQEMAEIIPESVFTTPSTGKMGINYDQLHAVYIKAIQELKAEIDELKKTIKIK